MLYQIKTQNGIVVAEIPVSYAQLYKESVPASIRGEMDETLGLLTLIELEVGFKIQTLDDLNNVNNHYKQYGFITVTDYLLYYMTGYISPHIKTCKSCKQFYDGTCLTYGHAVCATNWGCNNFI